MCGLVGVWSKKNKPVAQQVFDLYKKQSKRGMQGYGYMAISAEGKLVSVKRSKTESEIKSVLLKEKSPVILFHHRFPTSTDNTVGTTHPMSVSNDELEFDWYVSHNGKVANTNSLKIKHELLKYEYLTEFTEELVATHKNGRKEVLSTKGKRHNDSESLAIELARYLEDKSGTVGTTGPIAFWAVQLKKGTDEVVSIYYGRNHGRDLTVIGSKKYAGIASEGGSEVTPMKIYSYELGNPQLYEQEFSVEESRPIVTPAYQGRVMTEYERNRMRSAYDNLQNKHYKYSEMIDTGTAPSAFELILIDSICYYVPKKYASFTQGRQPLQHQHTIGFRGADDEQTEEEKDSALRALEDLCQRHAEIDTKKTNLEESCAQGFMAQPTYVRLTSQMEQEQSALEDAMSALGIEQEEVEVMMDMCAEAEDYLTTIGHAKKQKS